MSQKLERQVLQRTYKYDNGDYVMTLDLGRSGLDCDLGFDRGHLHVTVFHPQKGMIGEFSVPVRERIKGEPTYHHKNGIITLEAKLDEEIESNNFGREDLDEEYPEADAVDVIEDAEGDVEDEDETEEVEESADVEAEDDVEGQEADDSEEESEE